MSSFFSPLYHQEVVGTILDKVGIDVSPEDKGEALIDAAAGGYQEVVSTILDKVGIDISPEDKGEALTYAVACTVGNDQLGLVYCILNKAGKDISK